LDSANVPFLFTIFALTGYNIVKDTKRIFEKESRRKVEKALITDASESQLLLKYTKHR